MPTLREAFALGQDIHARTAAEVFGVPLEGMDPLTRRRAKAINFGIIYGISAFGLSRQLGISMGEARAYIDAYFARYPGIRDYMDERKIDHRRSPCKGRKDRGPALAHGSHGAFQRDRTAACLLLGDKSA